MTRKGVSLTRKNPPEFPSFYGPSSYKPKYTPPNAPVFVNTTGPDIKIDCDYYIPKKFQNIRSPPKPKPKTPRKLSKKVRFEQSSQAMPFGTVNLEPERIPERTLTKTSSISISPINSPKRMYGLDNTEEILDDTFNGAQAIGGLADTFGGLADTENDSSLNISQSLSSKEPYGSFILPSSRDYIDLQNESDSLDRFGYNSFQRSSQAMPLHSLDKIDNSFLDYSPTKSYNHIRSQDSSTQPQQNPTRERNQHYRPPKPNGFLG